MEYAISLGFLVKKYPTELNEREARVTRFRRGASPSKLHLNPKLVFHSNKTENTKLRFVQKGDIGEWLRVKHFSIHLHKLRP